MRGIYLLLMISIVSIVESRNNGDVTFSRHKDSMISDFTKIRSDKRFFQAYFDYSVYYLTHNMNFINKFTIVPNHINSAIERIDKMYNEMTANSNSTIEALPLQIRDYTLESGRLILSILQKIWALVLHSHDENDNFLKAFYNEAEKRCTTDGYHVSAQQKLYQLYILISRTILSAKTTVYTAYDKWKKESLSYEKYREYLNEAEEFFDDDFELYDSKIPNAIEISSNVIYPCFASKAYLMPGKFRQISLASFTSDIRENMVITGVQLYRHRRGVLYLQIMQGEIQVAGIVGPSDTATKEEKLEQNFKQSNIQISGRNIRFYLGDIILPAKHVVTGVRFVQRIENNIVQPFELQVRSTSYHYSTGNLQKNEAMSEWISINSPKTKRTVVELNTLDQPQNADTVSFFDPRMVQTNPPFPLSGVGLFVNDRSTRGKFLALRLRTLNIARHVHLQNDPRTSYTIDEISSNAIFPWDESPNK